MNEFSWDVVRSRAHYISDKYEPLLDSVLQWAIKKGVMDQPPPREMYSHKTRPRGLCLQTNLTRLTDEMGSRWQAGCSALCLLRCNKAERTVTEAYKTHNVSDVSPSHLSHFHTLFPHSFFTLSFSHSFLLHTSSLSSSPSLTRSCPSLPGLALTTTTALSRLLAIALALIPQS